jgi:hypothetical protein
LGLAFILPIVVVAFAIGLWIQFFRRARARTPVRVDEVVTAAPGRSGPRGWLAIVFLQALLVGAGLLAINSGSREEDRVEAVVPEQAIERHEAYAEQFVWAAGLTLGLAALVLVFRRQPAALALVSATALATIVVAGMAYRVGRAGGELVYVHNAGAAYSQRAEAATAGEQSPLVSPRVPRREREERDHERR